LKKHGTPKIQFVTSCFNTALAERCLHDKSLTIDVIIDYINTKYQLRDETDIDKASLIHSLIKYYTDKTTAGNVLVVEFYHYRILELDTSQQIEQSFFFFLCLVHLTLKAKAPVFPTAAYASSWEAERASKVVPRLTRQHVEKIEVLPLPTKRQRTKWSQKTTKQKRQRDRKIDNYAPFHQRIGSFNKISAQQIHSKASLP
jgi:hypothetical protein